MRRLNRGRRPSLDARAGACTGTATATAPRLAPLKTHSHSVLVHYYIVIDPGRAQRPSRHARACLRADRASTRPSSQHIGQPRSATRPNGAISMAAGPIAKTSAAAQPISPKPSAPRKRCLATNAGTEGDSRPSDIVTSSVAVDALGCRLRTCGQTRSQRLTPAMQTRLHRGLAETERPGGGRARHALDISQH